MTFEIVETEMNYCIIYKKEIVLTIWFQNDIEELNDHEVKSFYPKESAKEVAQILCELLNDDTSVLYKVLDNEVE